MDKMDHLMAEKERKKQSFKIKICNKIILYFFLTFFAFEFVPSYFLCNTLTHLEKCVRAGGIDSVKIDDTDSLNDKCEKQILTKFEFAEQIISVQSNSVITITVITNSRL